MPPVGSSVTACAIRNHKCCILVLKYAVLVLVADCFVLVINRFLFFRFSLVSVFSIFIVLVLVFVNRIIIFSFLLIFVFVFVNENHTAWTMHSKKKSCPPFSTRDVFRPCCETCTVIQQQFWMKEYDIIRGIETYSEPSYIFSVGEDLNPNDLRPWLLQLSPNKMLFIQQVGGINRHVFDSVHVYESKRANTFSWQPLLKVNNTEYYFEHKLNMCVQIFCLGINFSN